MKFETLKDYFLTKIKERDFSDFNSADLAFHIPISTSFLNFVLRELVVSSLGMKNLESVELGELNDDEFRIKIHHKLLNKRLNCAIDEMGTTKHGEAVLTVEFIGGLKFYERAVLNTLFLAKKGWGWLKSKMADDDSQLPVKKRPAFEITGSHFSVNMSEFLRMQGLDFLIPLIKWERFSTKNDMLIVDFRLKI